MESARVLEKAGTKTLGMYIAKWQEKLAEWVGLRPILENYDMERDYTGGGEALVAVVAENGV